MNDEYRTDATLTGSERDQIESFLHDNRAEIVGLLDGLTEAQARRRLVPSLTTLLGLVKHAAFAERVWFDVALAGRTRAEIGLPTAVDDSFILTDDDTIESVVAEYRRPGRTPTRLRRRTRSTTSRCTTAADRCPCAGSTCT